MDPILSGLCRLVNTNLQELSAVDFWPQKCPPGLLRIYSCNKHVYLTHAWYQTSKNRCTVKWDMPLPSKTYRGRWDYLKGSLVVNYDECFGGKKHKDPWRHRRGRREHCSVSSHFCIKMWQFDTCPLAIFAISSWWVKLPIWVVTLVLRDSNLLTMFVSMALHLAQISHSHHVYS